MAIELEVRGVTTPYVITLGRPHLSSETIDHGLCAVMAALAQHPEVTREHLEGVAMARQYFRNVAKNMK